MIYNKLKNFQEERDVVKFEINNLLLSAQLGSLCFFGSTFATRKISHNDLAQLSVVSRHCCKGVDEKEFSSKRFLKTFSGVNLWSKRSSKYFAPCVTKLSSIFVLSRPPMTCFWGCWCINAISPATLVMSIWMNTKYEESIIIMANTVLQVKK